MKTALLTTFAASTALFFGAAPADAQDPSRSRIIDSPIEYDFVNRYGLQPHQRFGRYDPQDTAKYQARRYSGYRGGYGYNPGFGGSGFNSGFRGYNPVGYGYGGSPYGGGYGFNRGYSPAGFGGFGYGGGYGYNPGFGGRGFSVNRYR